MYREVPSNLCPMSLNLASYIMIVLYNIKTRK